MSLKRNYSTAENVARWLEGLRVGRQWRTYADIVTASRQRITASTLSNILNRRYDDVDEDTLHALADAFEVPFDDVWAIAHGQAGATGEQSDTESRTVTLPAELWQKLMTLEVAPNVQPIIFFKRSWSACG